MAFGRNKKEGTPRMSAEEYKAWLDQQEIVERDGVTYVVVDGVEYPAGLEPDPNLTGRELLIAQKKEATWIFAMRMGFVGLVIMIGLLVFCIVTKYRTPRAGSGESAGRAGSQARASQLVAHMRRGAARCDAVQKLSFVWLKRVSWPKTLDCVVENDRAFGDEGC